MNEELIPCNDELNRLKEFLANFSPPQRRYAGEDHMIYGLNTVFFGPNPGIPTLTLNEITALREEIRECWAALRDLERKRIVY